ncbi:MAG: cytochrome c [Gammaproteobacteria bacterium]|nr:cytochrome c [Gammaproteobacteria bacterium]
MVNRSQVTSMVLDGVLGLASVTAIAADGETVYNTKACSACHGPNGAAPIQPSYPKLAGQNSAYLVQQIKDIRDGVRTNGQSAVMKPIVGALTDAEIEAVATYLSGVK